MSFFRSKRHAGRRNVYYRQKYRRWDFMRDARQCIVSVIGPHLSSKRPIIEFQESTESHISEGRVTGEYLTTKIELPVNFDTTMQMWGMKPNNISSSPHEYSNLDHGLRTHIPSNNWYSISIKLPCQPLFVKLDNAYCVDSNFTASSGNIITLVQTERDQPDAKIALYMLLLDKRISQDYSENICTLDDQQSILDNYEILWDKSTPVKYLPGVKLTNFYRDPSVFQTRAASTDYLADIRINPSNLVGLDKFLKNTEPASSAFLKLLSPSSPKKYSRFAELDQFFNSKTAEKLSTVKVPALNSVLSGWKKNEETSKLSGLIIATLLAARCAAVRKR